MDRTPQSRNGVRAGRGRGALKLSGRRRADGARLGLMAGCGLLAAGAMAVLTAGGPRSGAARADAQADRALREAAPSPDTLDRAARALEATAGARPADARRVARLAAIEIRRRGALTPRAQALLMRTYELEPLGPGLTLWRWDLVFNHWSAAGPALRAAALAEMDAVFGRQGWAMQARVPDIIDDRGRMAAAMAAQRLRRREALRIASPAP
jgi:hypothetical protein